MQHFRLAVLLLLLLFYLFKGSFPWSACTASLGRSSQSSALFRWWRWRGIWLRWRSGSLSFWFWWIDFRTWLDAQWYTSDAIKVLVVRISSSTEQIVTEGFRAMLSYFARDHATQGGGRFPFSTFLWRFLSILLLSAFISLTFSVKRVDKRQLSPKMISE